ncbi:MAG: hypothetical protein PHS49_03195 [Candidatus Gracilibacteria bacterium]|nr:hypothetical protein [Candidatus Gracilibacteria bacterium]
MKYIVSFFTLLVYLVIGFFQSPMITFAMQENNVHEMNTHNIVTVSESDCCGNTIVDDSQDNNDCNHECCFQSKGVSTSSISISSNGTQKIDKIKFKNNIDIFSVSINSFSNKNLIKKTSPPLFNREIKNYSYCEFVKIIKSNI